VSSTVTTRDTYRVPRREVFAARVTCSFGNRLVPSPQSLVPCLKSLFPTPYSLLHRDPNHGEHTIPPKTPSNQLNPINLIVFYFAMLSAFGHFLLHPCSKIPGKIAFRGSPGSAFFQVEVPSCLRKTMGDTFQSALNVLVVEDDKELAGFVRQGLEDERCIVKVCHDGGSGLRQAEIHAFDIILLDVMLPVLNGFEVTRRLRMQKIRTPILLLTARDSPEDIVNGLDAGADDYLTKPFVFEVLLARIRARTRSTPARSAAQMRFADLFLDAEKHEVIRAGERLDLTRTEFSILENLMRAAGRVITRSRLIELVWGDREVSDNNLDVFIRYLRTKVDRPGMPRLLHTERGLGYCLREGAD
jgi:DNA-binding response OmpR family regulator